MTPKKAFIGMLAVLGITILGTAGGVYFADTKLSSRAENISTLKADLEVTQKQIDNYEEAQAKVEELSFINDIAKDVLPNEKSQDEAVVELQKFAKESNIEIRAIDFTGGDTASTDPNISQTEQLEGVEGVRVLTATVTLKEGLQYSQFINFLQKVEKNQRKMQVKGVTIIPDASNRDKLTNVTLSLEFYLKA